MTVSVQTGFRWFSIILLLIPIVGGCRDGGDATPAESSARDSTAASPREIAVQAQTDLLEQLLNRLMAGMAQGGPAAAIPICKEEAPRIARLVGETHGVSIGRTSFRLRNSANTPPAWAVPLIEQRVAEPTFLDLEDGRLGAFLPIRLKPQCTFCHGPKEELIPEVQDALAEQYPDDQATGFQEGDLRGWFWVEVPARSEGGAG